MTIYEIKRGSLCTYELASAALSFLGGGYTSEDRNDLLQIMLDNLEPMQEEYAEYDIEITNELLDQAADYMVETIRKKENDLKEEEDEEGEKA